MNNDYIISVMTKSSDQSIYERPRPRRTLKSHKYNCNKGSKPIVISNTEAKAETETTIIAAATTTTTATTAGIHDTNHVIEVDEHEHFVDIKETSQKLSTSLILRNNKNNNMPRNTKHNIKPNKKTSECFCDFSFSYFKISNLNLITTFCLSVLIRIWIWLVYWLSWNINIEWRLQKNSYKSIFNIFYIHYMLMICLMITISVAHESTDQQFQQFQNNDGKYFHGSSSVSQKKFHDLSSTFSPELSEISYSTSLAMPASNEDFTKRIANLLSREDILLRQQQQNVPSTNKNNSPVIPSTSTCSTCHAREKAKLDSLETIKMHILTQLRVNRTAEELSKPRHVPQNILDKYNREYDSNGQRRDYKSKSNQKYQNNYNRHQNLYDKIDTNIDSMQKNDYDEKMQSDDPNIYSDYDEHDEEDLYSHINSIYVFPISSRLRHNRKSEFLTFKFESNEETVITGAVLHLYIRGQDWMKEFRPEVMQQIPKNETIPDLLFNVHRALKRTNAYNYTHTIPMAQVQQKIPSGLGKWIQIELPDLPKLWMDKVQDINFIIVVKTKEDWMRYFVETGRSDLIGAESALTAHIEIRTQLGLGRHRRSASLDCQESDNELRCCRYPLKVNFTSFGWSFVVAPTDFDAYFCNGECKLGFLNEHPHTHLASLTRSASPCCSPTKMSSLTLLYFNLEQNLVLSTIPNMTVEKCSCS